MGIYGNAPTTGQPAVHPLYGRDLQIRAAGLAVVGVEDQEIAAAVMEDGFVAGAAPVRCSGFDHQRAAAFGHGLAGLVDIRAGDLAPAAHHHVVRAVDAAAAAVEGYEEVEPAAVPDQERRLDGAADGRRARTAGQRVASRV
jgi:hypothetical protein